MTNYEKLQRAAELRAQADQLEKEARGREWSEGWSSDYEGVIVRENLCGNNFVIAQTTRSGLVIHPDVSPALDGIPHDSKGRIRVVGYVPAEETKEILDEYFALEQMSQESLYELIDKLERCES